MQDPPLTSLGKDQAKQTGLFLKKYLDENDYTHIFIESSPYLRALQTASEVAQVLDIQSIRVNYIYSEWMKAKFFTSNPIDTLLLRTQGAEYISLNYLDNKVKI